MVEISVFVDESGEFGTESKRYLLTLVFHEQKDSISEQISRYQQSLMIRGLPDVPFHASPLLNGHDDYEGFEIGIRKQLLASFFTMLQHLPIRYRTFAYEKGEYAAGGDLCAKMKRDVINMMLENLEYFQGFEKVNIYYDDGQALVSRVLRDAAEYALSAGAVVHKECNPQSLMLAQAADLLCTIELTAIKYSRHEQTRTDERFFGAAGSFKKNWLKKVRKMVM